MSRVTECSTLLVLRCEFPHGARGEGHDDLYTSAVSFPRTINYLLSLPFPALKLQQCYLRGNNSVRKISEQRNAEDLIHQTATQAALQVLEVYRCNLV